MKSQLEKLMAVSVWCNTCSARHDLETICPGTLPATGPERHAWRGIAETSIGSDTYGVLVAPSHDLWRARVLTYPNVLWLVPGGIVPLKFFAAEPSQAERSAVDYIEEHCRKSGYLLREDRSWSEQWGEARVIEATAPRKNLFLPVRFGEEQPVEIADTGNLSETGLFVITETPPAKGCTVRLLLETPATTLELQGHVRWTRDRPDGGQAAGMGVRLQAPPPDYVEYVRSL